MVSKKLSLLPILGLFAIMLIAVSCEQDRLSDDNLDRANLVAGYDAEAAYEWNEVYLEIERYAAGYRPGPAPRSLAYLGLATYEACLNGMPDYNSLEGRYPGLVIPKADSKQKYHWPTVVHAIYTRMMPRFFPNPQADANARMLSLISHLNSKYEQEAGAEVYARSKEHGERVADAVWNWSATDAVGHDAYLDPFGTYDWQANYDEPGDWVATTPGPGKPMFPYWGQARRFAINESDRLCAPPIPYSESPNSELYSQAIEVYSQNTPTLSYIDEWVGEFWSDDLLNLTFSPGPRWIAIASQVIKNESSNLETAIEAYAKVGMALNDAAVACWHSKYYYNVERPESYIQRLIDPSWEPNLYDPISGAEGISPSFPAYPSGHSTMGAAGAEALASVWGYSYSMTDNCHRNRTEFEGVPRTFSSFYDMGAENAWSRVPLGVHFRMDADEGVRLGTAIGRKVNALPWKN